MTLTCCLSDLTSLSRPVSVSTDSGLQDQTSTPEPPITQKVPDPSPIPESNLHSSLPWVSQFPNLSSHESWFRTLPELPSFSSTNPDQSLWISTVPFSFPVPPLYPPRVDWAKTNINCRSASEWSNPYGRSFRSGSGSRSPSQSDRSRSSNS